MPDTSDDLITIREGDLVESLTMAMHAEHLDDETCNSVIATLLDAITNNESIIRHTDAEVLQEIAAILWPPSNPNREWSADTLQEVADTLLLLRPELEPWRFSCLVDHGWVENALDCAERRSEAALNAYLSSDGGECAAEVLQEYEPVEAAESIVDALTRLLESESDD
jgi:hypothetical protein